MSDPALTIVNARGETQVIYAPLPHQVEFHKSTAPNLLALGTRGTGKSLQLRFDAIIRCLSIPNFHALIVRRTMPELRRSHLVYIDYEMKLLGGIYLHTTCVAKFDNGSSITLAHCETEADILNFLSSQYGAIYFDELSTFTLNQFLQISASARAPTTAPYQAVVRAGSNPLGIGSEWLRQWFVDKCVDVEEYPDYHPDDYQMIFSTLADNPHLDQKEYTARLRNLPEHIRRAWLLGEFVDEGSYFSDFHPYKDSDPWHVLDEMPTVHGQPLLDQPWLHIYRALDWGYAPDPAVCLWIAVLPDTTAIVFKERTWTRTLAADVAKAIVKESQGMRVVETFCDPTMFIKSGASVMSVGDLFETNGVPLTSSINKRESFGYAIHQYLNQIIDQHPQLRIVKPLGLYGCPHLIRTLPQLRMDKHDPSKIAEGEDHYAVALAYFTLGLAAPSRDPVSPVIKPWMRPKGQHRQVYLV